MDASNVIWIGIGAVVGALAVLLGGRGTPASPARPAKPTMLGWSALALGLLTVVLSFLVTGGGSSRVFWVIGAGIAALIAGIGAVVKRDRHWPTWTGLA